MELDKYYLTSGGMIAIVSQAEDAECPILGYGSIGSCGDFSHLADMDIDFKEAKKKYGDRCVGVGYRSPASGCYSFFRDDDNPSLFFVYDESALYELKKDKLEEFIDGTIKDFESWAMGYVYDVRTFYVDKDLPESESLLWIGLSSDYDTKPVCEIDKEVRMLEELQECGTSEEIEAVLTLIRAKAKRFGLKIEE